MVVVVVVPSLLLVVVGVRSVPGVKAEMYLPEIFNRWPHIRVTWDEAKLAAKPADIIHKMRHGEPSILVFPSQGGLDLGVITLKPGERALIPTGLALALPDGHEAQVRPRSGLAWEHGVTVLNAPGTIDADYRGEIKIIMANFSKEPFKLQRGARIAQFVIAPA